MTKVVRCRDVGFDCDGVVRAETEEEVLRQVAEHAKAVHNLEEISEEVILSVRSFSGRFAGIGTHSGVDAR